MFPSVKFLKKMLLDTLINKEEQGYEVSALYGELQAMPDSYDSVSEFASKLGKLSYRSGWNYVEPDDLDDILETCGKNRPQGAISKIDFGNSAERVQTAFYASVCGCILGKPVEEFPLPTYYEMKKALQKAGEWPMRDYLTEGTLQALGRRNVCWTETTRGRIEYVAADDDITYTIMGMRIPMIV